MSKESNAIKAAIFEMALLFNQQPNDERITAYAKALQNYSPSQIKFAFNSVILSGTAFFPSLAEILTHLRPIKPKSEDIAVQLVDEIVRAAIEHGQYRVDRAYEALSDSAKEVLGGDKQAILNICKSMEDELPIIKAQLRNLFRSKLESQKASEHHGKLLRLGIKVEPMRKISFDPGEA